MTQAILDSDRQLVTAVICHGYLNSSSSLCCSSSPRSGDRSRFNKSASFMAIVCADGGHCFHFDLCSYATCDAIILWLAVSKTLEMTG
jgi:hypothetical protein